MGRDWRVSWRLGPSAVSLPGDLAVEEEAGLAGRLHRGCLTAFEWISLCQYPNVSITVHNCKNIFGDDLIFSCYQIFSSNSLSNSQSLTLSPYIWLPGIWTSEPSLLIVLWLGFLPLLICPWDWQHLQCLIAFGTEGAEGVGRAGGVGDAHPCSPMAALTHAHPCRCGSYSRHTRCCMAFQI